MNTSLGAQNVGEGEGWGKNLPWLLICSIVQKCIKKTQNKPMENNKPNSVLNNFKQILTFKLKSNKTKLGSRSGKQKLT